LFIDDGRILFRTVLGKFFCCSASLASGIALGREGPSVQVGAGLTSVVARNLELDPKQVAALVPAGCAAALFHVAGYRLVHPAEFAIYVCASRDRRAWTGLLRQTSAGTPRVVHAADGRCTSGEPVWLIESVRRKISIIAAAVEPAIEIL